LTAKEVNSTMDDVLAESGVQRRRFTAEEYHRLAEVGILHEDDRVELIEGEIIIMAPIGLRHATCVALLNRELTLALGRRAFLWPQNPVRLFPDTEPQPDVVILRERADDYAHAPARPSDVLLLVEVADTSYRYDRRVKLPLYARSGVAELWIVDLTRDLIEIYRDRQTDRYATTTQVRRGGVVAPAAFPDIVLAVDAILPDWPNRSIKPPTTGTR
jgi:Uma2 family endonuclease